MTVWLQVWAVLLHGLFAQAVLPWPGTSVPVAPPPASGMQVWYIAGVGNDCSGSPCTDGANQTTWTDQSGNGNTGHGDGTRAVASGQPVCIQSVYHTNQINGKPALTLNGNATTPSCFGLVSSISLSTAATAFLVGIKSASCTGTQISNNLDCDIMGGGGTSLNWGSGGANQPNLSKACTTRIGTSTTNPGNVWVQMNVVYTAASGAWAFRNNRSANGSGTNVQTIVNGYLGLGGNGCSASNLNPFNGQMAEFILYNRALSGAEITTVETYLHSRYGL